MNSRLSNKIIQASGLIVMIIGLISLIGWFMGSVKMFSTFYLLKIVPAPSSSLIFVLYGIAIFLYAFKEQSRKIRLIGIGLGFLGVVASLLLFFLFLLKIRPSVEHLGMAIVQSTTQGLVFGHMSPVTAFCFVLAGIMLVLLLSISSSRPWRKKAVFWTALVIALINLILLIIYLFNGNLFYGSNIIISPALLTVLLFMIIAIVWLWV